MRHSKIVTVAGYVLGFDQPWCFHSWVEVTRKAARELQREKAKVKAARELQAADCIGPKNGIDD